MAASALHQQPSSEIATITGLPLNEYEEIVKPHRQLLISDYFINYWVSRLNPTLAWIVVALQQACWRADADTCTISQAQICREVGINRTTITRALKSPWRPWLIPNITYNQPIFNYQKGAFQPLPAQYTVYLSPPLIPEHLTGFFGYLQANGSPTTPALITETIRRLLDQPTKQALKTLEAHTAPQPLFNEPLPLVTVVESATGLKLNHLSLRQATHLKRQLSALQSHLTRGDTLCRQYFRLNWAPKLSPALAWLVMTLRSRCYYNKTTGELRDTYTWRKKDLAQILGQSTQNLRTRLLKHKYAAHFFQILDDQKHKITIRVGMLEEPLTTETAQEYWLRQAKNANFCNIGTPKTQTFATSELPKRKLLQHRSPQNANFRNIEAAQTQTFATQSLKTLNLKDSASDLKHFQHGQNSAAYQDQLWQDVLEQLQLHMTKATFIMWLKNTRLANVVGQKYTIIVENNRAKDWLEHRLNQTVVRALSQIVGQEDIQIEFVVRDGKTDRS